jgi:hypothetical protein
VRGVEYRERIGDGGDGPHSGELGVFGLSEDDALQDAWAKRDEHSLARFHVDVLRDAVSEGLTCRLSGVHGDFGEARAGGRDFRGVVAGAVEEGWGAHVGIVKDFLDGACARSVLSADCPVLEGVRA